MTSHTDTLTVAQAAEALGVSERTIWRYLKSGRLPGETTGSPGSQRTLIAVEAIDGLRSERGGAGQSDELRGERDRLMVALRATERERDQLRDRVTVLQRAVAEPHRPGPMARALEGAMVMANRARSLRTSF